jgi:hypothetical protein
MGQLESPALSLAQALLIIQLAECVISTEASHMNPQY